jgi:hypothetical protein
MFTMTFSPKGRSEVASLPSPLRRQTRIVEGREERRDVELREMEILSGGAVDHDGCLAGRLIRRAEVT